MEPISSGFQEGRRLSEALMNRVCEDVLRGDNEQVKKVSAAPLWVRVLCAELQQS